jgi:hypothetical protein
MLVRSSRIWSLCPARDVSCNVRVRLCTIGPVLDSLRDYNGGWQVEFVEVEADSKTTTFYEDKPIEQLNSLPLVWEDTSVRILRYFDERSERHDPEFDDMDSDSFRISGHVDVEWTIYHITPSEALWSQWAPVLQQSLATLPKE